MKKIKQFVALDARQKIIFTQAWIMLGWMRAAILSTSFKSLSASLNHHSDVPCTPTLNGQQFKWAADIGRLVAIAARYTPWQSRCLVQVLVSQRLLAKHNIAGQFYLGVRKGSEDGIDPCGLSAHAWLACGGEIVNGGPGHEQYVVVSTFSWGSTEGN